MQPVIMNLPLWQAPTPLTASKYGYSTASVSGVVVTPPGATTQDFTLTPKAQITVNGTVTDGSGAGWPLYATIHIEATGFSTTVFTSPLTGQYSLNLFETTDYTFTVSSAGYTTATAPVTTGSTSPVDAELQPYCETETVMHRDTTGVEFENFEIV